MALPATCPVCAAAGTLAPQQGQPLPTGSVGQFPYRCSACQALVLVVLP